MKVYVLFEERRYYDGGVCDVIDGIYSNLDAAERAKEQAEGFDRNRNQIYLWIDEHEVEE
jgi:hypothetical protein